ncbi:MAG: hypothetical protein DRH12_17015, partial [Deltaproteobacteria bacterium]
MTNKLVSIGLPVYNGEKFLRRAILSLLTQDYENIELVISDNASTDATPKICQEFARDPRVHYFRQKRDIGMGANFQFVLDKARGEYFMWACHDDEWSHNLISSLVAKLESDPSLVLAFPKNRFVSESGQFEIDCSRLPQLTEKLPILQRLHNILWFEEGHQKGNAAFGLIRTNVAKRIGVPIVNIPAYGNFGGDQLFLFALAFHGFFAYVPEATFTKMYFPNRDYTPEHILEHFHEMQGYFARYREIVLNSDLSELEKDLMLSSISARETVWYARLTNAAGYSDLEKKIKLILKYSDQYGTQEKVPTEPQTDSDFSNILTSIIILNYNGKDHIKKCIDSIRRHTKTPYEIIVFDNASTDGSRQYLRTQDDIILIESPMNIGCPPGRAKAMALAKGDYIVLLDNDTIVTPQWLTKLLSHMVRDKKIGIIGPRSNYVSGPQLVQNCSYRTIFEMEQFSKLLALEAEMTNPLTPVLRLVGFCMLIRRDLVEKIGAPDPSFGKFGFEDDDYTLRARIAGYDTVIANDVFVHHTGGPQGKGDSYYSHLLLHAWEIFKKKWGLPINLPYGALNRESLLKKSFDPERDYIPLPKLGEVEPYIYKREQRHSYVSKNDHDSVRGKKISPGLARAMAPAIAQYYLGQFEEAVQAFQKLVSPYEDLFQIHMALGCMLAKKGQMKQSVEHLRRAMHLEPNFCKPGNALGRALMAIGRGQEAERAFKEADKVSLYSLQAKFNLIRYYMSERKTDQAMQIAFQAYHREPNNNKVITILAHIPIISKRYKEATEYLRHYLTLAPKDPDAFLLLFKAYRENGDKEKALEVLTAIKSLAQKDKAVFDRLLTLFDAHQVALKDGRSIHIILRAAGSLFHNLNWEDDFSIDFLVKEDFLETLYEFAKSLYETSHADEAFVIYKELNNLAPNHALVHNDLATILWDKGDVEAALKHISQAVKLNPWDKDIVWNSGQIL